jgi:type II secretory pathway pseudopilin PulG
MKKINNGSGFSVVELLLVIVIVILLGFMGWYIYHNDHKTNVNTTKSSSTSTTIYSNWKTFVTSYQKLSFKYPNNWVLTDNSTSNGNDDITIKSPAGLSIYMQALIPISSTDITASIISTSNIKFTGQSDYLLYYSSAAAQNNSTTGPVDEAHLSSSSTQVVYPSANTSDGTVWNISITTPSAIQLSNIPTNSDFQNAEQIIESASY